MLADVEGLEVEAVGADFQQQWVDEHLGEAMAVVLEEGLSEGGEVAEKVGCAGVWLEGGVGWDGNGGLRSGSEAHHDAGDEQAEGLVWETFGERVLAGGAELGGVAVEECGDLC